MEKSIFFSEVSFCKYLDWDWKEEYFYLGKQHSYGKKANLIVSEKLRG